MPSKSPSPYALLTKRPARHKLLADRGRQGCSFRQSSMREAVLGRTSALASALDTRMAVFMKDTPTWMEMASVLNAAYSQTSSWTY
eukprot:607932-Pleurochrysis_carterae.AAC.1